MRAETKAKLDREMWKHRLRVIGGFAAAACALVVFLALFLPVTSESIAGTVNPESADLADDGNNPYLLVELENGIEVKVAIPQGLLDVTQSKVWISKYQTLVGATTYSFQGYINSPSLQ